MKLGPFNNIFSKSAHVESRGNEYWIQKYMKEAIIALVKLLS
jgi:hypothetical protein